MGFLNRITCNPTVCCGCIPLRGGTLLLLWLNVDVRGLSMEEGFQGFHKPYMVLSSDWLMLENWGALKVFSRTILGDYSGFEGFIVDYGTGEVIAVLTVLQILGSIMSSLPHNGSSSNFTYQEPFNIPLIWVFLYGISSVLGLYAILGNKSPSFFKPYIYLTTVDVVLYALVTLVATVFLPFYYTNEANPKPGLALLYFIVLFISMLKWHLFSVVYRYYEQLKAEDNASSVPYQQDAIP